MKKTKISDFTNDDIISVSRKSPIFRMTWCIDTACNYDCSYCSSLLHDANDLTQKSLEDMKNIWYIIYDQIKDNFNKVDIGFTGGEVTINKNFLPFIRWLHKNYNIVNYMSLTTNGSASTAYYLEAIKYLSHLTLSTHLEWFNERKFFETVVHCFEDFKSRNKPYQFKVQLMGEEFNKEFIDKLDLYESFLEKMGISYSRKRLQFGTQKHINEFKITTEHILKKQTDQSKFNFEEYMNG